MRKSVLVAVFTLSAALALGGLAIERSGSTTSALQRDAANRLHTYCIGLRSQLDGYYSMLTYGDNETKARIGRVFTNAVVYKQLEREDLCSTHPPDLHMRDVCWVNLDYKCLAKLAATARDAIDY